MPLSYLLIYARNHTVVFEKLIKASMLFIYYTYEHKRVCKFSMHILNFFPNPQFTNHSFSTPGNGLEEAQLEQNKDCTLVRKILLTSNMDNTEIKKKQKNQSALGREGKIKRQSSLNSFTNKKSKILRLLLILFLIFPVLFYQKN